MKNKSLFVIHLFFLLSAFLPPPVMAGPGPVPPAIPLKGNDGTLESCCAKLMSAKRSIFYLNDWSYKMTLQLRGIYTREETMFFCLGIRNHSHINYSVDSIRFYIADVKGSDNKLVKGTGMIPLCTYGNTRMIHGKTREYCVFALPRFTLPAKKLLVIDVSEKNGGRHLQLLANNYTLVRARLI